MATRNRYAQKKVINIKSVLQELRRNENYEIASDKIQNNVRWILGYTKNANDVKIIHHCGGIKVLLNTLYWHSQKDVDIARRTLAAIGNCLKYPNELPQVRMISTSAHISVISLVFCQCSIQYIEIISNELSVTA